MSFGSAMAATTSTIDADYELPTATITVDEDQQEAGKGDSGDPMSEIVSNKQQQQLIQDEELEMMRSGHGLPMHLDDHVQEDDVLVEENITPFYMNSGRLLRKRFSVSLDLSFALFVGENLQQTLRRLGIELPDSLLNENNF